MLNLTASKPQLKVVFDQAGTPTYAYDLAKAIAVIINDYSSSVSDERLAVSEPFQTNDQLVNSLTRQLVNYSNTGVYHFSNEGVCSWYDFTKMIQEYSGQKACDVQPCHSSEFPSPVTRPSYSVLDKTKIKQTFSVAIPYWTDSLRLCISNLK